MDTVVMKSNIINTESRLKEIKLPADLYKEAENLIGRFLKEDNIARIKQIANSFGLKFDIKFCIEIVSAEEKYLFNYLSGAFGNKDLEEGAKNLHNFLDSKRYLEAINHLSGRAIHSKTIVDKVIRSLGYLEEIRYLSEKDSFMARMRSFCNKIINQLKINKGVIVVGVSPKEILKPFDELLAHELFHLVLTDNGIWFQGINEEYDYLDEGLATLLARKYSKNKKDRTEIYWSETLIPLKEEERIIKLRKIYDDLKAQTHDFLMDSTLFE